MDVETEVGDAAVTVYVDGSHAGTLDREWWREWTARIDDAPEACLASCLSLPDGDPRRRRGE